MVRAAWTVSVVCGGVERVRCFEEEGDAITAFRAMARDAQARVDVGGIAQARATLSHGGRLLVGYTMLPRAS